jgi:hypothetical protein
VVHTSDGGGLIVNVNLISSVITEEFNLYQNYPNPFNPVTVIGYQLRVSSYVKLKVFDIEGKEIIELISQRQYAGEHKIKFDGSSFPSGVYFYKLETEKFSEVKKMILIR